MKLFGYSLLLLTVLALNAGCGPKDDETMGPEIPMHSAAGPRAPAAKVKIVLIKMGSGGMGAAAFGENPLVVTAGTLVTWKNVDDMPHTITSDSNVFDSGPIEPGESFSHGFTKPGLYPYTCTMHGAASMSGIVKVIP